MHNTLGVEKLISKAKIGLILNQPWFGQLAMRLLVLDGTGIGVDTMATDGTHLYYHEPFVTGLTAAELTGVVAHEILHCAMLHPYRRGNRDNLLWNIACDYLVNDILIKAGFTLPKGALIEAKYSGMSAEKVYAILAANPAQVPPPCPWGKVRDSPPQPGKPGKPGQPEPGKDAGKDGKDGKDAGKDKPGQPGPGAGKPGDKPGTQPGTQPGTGGDGKPGDAGEVIRTEHDWVIDTIQAEKIATSAGKMPGGIGTSVREARKTRTNYREPLKRFIDNSLPVDFSWAKPNRRLLSQGVVVPGVHKENTGEMVIGVDTSGSVGTAMLDQFAADIAHIISEYRPTKVHVVYCDTRVTRTAEFEPDGEPFKFEKNVSRGGTYFQPVFDWVREKEITPRVLIYLTDLEPADKPVEPEYPVLWGVPETCRRSTWDWGEVVEVTMDR